jgi:hypothetical protein
MQLRGAAHSAAVPGVKEYEYFHELLHPLEHEALPKKDFVRIRANAKDLVKRGEAIVKLGVPAGTAENNVTEFRKELSKFGDALKQFSRFAKSGTDKELEESFSAVHDSFEMLMGMLPR